MQDDMRRQESVVTDANNSLAQTMVARIRAVVDLDRLR